MSNSEIQQNIGDLETTGYTVPVIDHDRVQDLGTALDFVPKVELQLPNSPKVIGIREGDETVLYPDTMQHLVFPSVPQRSEVQTQVPTTEDPRITTRFLAEETLQYPDMFFQLLTDIEYKYTHAGVLAEIPFDAARTYIRSKLDKLRALPDLRNSDKPEDKEEYNKGFSALISLLKRIQNIDGAAKAVQEYTFNSGTIAAGGED